MVFAQLTKSTDLKQCFQLPWRTAGFSPKLAAERFIGSTFIRERPVATHFWGRAKLGLSELHSCMPDTEKLLVRWSNEFAQKQAVK